MKTPILATLLALCTASLALGGDCPRITCERAQELVTERCPARYDIGCPDCNCPEAPPCPKAVATTITKVVEVPTNVVTLVYNDITPKSHALLFGGLLLYRDFVTGANKLGGTVVAGRQFANGMAVMGGPTYMPQNNLPPYSGTVPYRCYQVPFTVPGQQAANPFGLQLLVGYVF